MSMLLRGFIIILAVLLVNRALFSSSFDPWKTTYTESLKAKKERNYDKAYVLGLKAVKLSLLSKNGDKTQGISILNLLDLYVKQEQFKKAERLYLLYLNKFIKMRKENSLMAMSLLDGLSTLYLKMDDFPKAESYLIRVIKVFKTQSPKKQDENAAYLSILYAQLALVYFHEAKYKLAELYYEKSLTLLKGTSLQNSELKARVLYGMSALNSILGRSDKEKALYWESKKQSKRMFQENSIEHASDLIYSADSYEAEGRFQKAEKAYIQALQIEEEYYGKQSPYLINTLDSIGNFYIDRKQFKKAELYLNRALPLSRKGSTNEASILHNLSKLYHAQGDYKKAELLAKEVFAIDEKKLGLEHPTTAIHFVSWARNYKSQKKTHEAFKLYQKALSIFQKSFPADHPKTAIVINEIGELYEIEGEFDKAEQQYRDALAMNGRLVPNAQNNRELLHILSNMLSVNTAKRRPAVAFYYYFRAIWVKRNLPV